MKKSLVVAVGLVSLALPLSAQEPVGWYVKGEVGPAWTEEIEVDEFISSLSGIDAKLDIGFRYNVGGGYRFCEWFATEVETGVIYNSIDEIGGADDLGDSSLVNVPLMANAIFEIPTRTPFTPYAGLGIGMSFTVIDLDDVGSVDGSDSDAVFAYQALAGMRYTVTDRWAVTLAYKYLGTTDPSWDVRGTSGDIEFEGASSHAVLAGFQFSF